MPVRSWLPTLVAAFLALGAGPATAAIAFPNGQAIATAGARLPKLVLDTAAGPLPLAKLSGRWTWLYMGYSNCPDICPTTMNWLAAEHKRLPKPDDVQVLFVSVDPARDTPVRLAAYSKFFDPSIIGATADRATIDALAAAVGARYEIPAGAKPSEAYAVAHTNAIFVIDPDGRVATSYLPEGDGLAADFAAMQAARPVPRVPAPAEGPVVAWCDPDQPDWLMERWRSQGSGTSLLPAASPMRMWALKVGDWRWMLDGSALGGYNVQGGPRGDLTWAAENWQMLMGSGQVGPGLLDLHLMTSLEPFTLPPGGTPQLLQEGETYKFQPLIDHQHPHDLFMELAARYTWRVAGQTDLFVYGGPAGEPALGPTAYMHRPSAAENPWAPLAHHLQDSTHITYGVATVGAKHGPVQLEGSVFNGREPDEYRYNFDFGPLDSYSARLSYAPDAHWVAQVSHGHLHDVDWVFHPGADMERTTASVLTVQDTRWGPWSTQMVWGENLEAHPPLTGLFPFQSYGLESELDVTDFGHLYGRLEVFDRDGLPPDPPLNHVTHRLEAVTVGAVKELGLSRLYDLGLGADLTLYGMDSTLQGVYGYNPLSFRVYLRLKPPVMGAHPGGAVPPHTP